MGLKKVYFSFHIDPNPNISFFNKPLRFENKSKGLIQKWITRNKTKKGQMILSKHNKIPRQNNPRTMLLQRGRGKILLNKLAFCSIRKHHNLTKIADCQETKKKCMLIISPKTANLISRNICKWHGQNPTFMQKPNNLFHISLATTKCKKDGSSS